MFHHLGLLWMIQTRERYEFSLIIILLFGVQEGHGLTEKFQDLNGPVLEYFFLTARQDIYELIYGLHA